MRLNSGQLIRHLIMGTLLWASPLAPLHAAESGEFQVIVVQPGDTLWGISQQYLKDPQKWPELLNYNQLSVSDPTVALPGTRLRVPVSLVKEQYRKAVLLSHVPSVRYKRKGEVDWHNVKNNMDLLYEDSVRTLDGGNAKIRFPTKEIVQIDENSYVVLKPEKIMQEVRLIEGNVRASRSKVIMPQGTVVQPRGDKSEYQARIRDDKTEVVFVYKGKVDVTAQGKTVQVEEGFGTTVPRFSAPHKPIPLSRFPDFRPVDVSNNAPKVDIVQKNSGIIDIKPPKPSEQESKSKSRSVISNNILSSYRVQLSETDSFTTIAAEKLIKLGSPFDIKALSIPDGNYFMRVSFIDALGSAGPFSEVTSVVKDTSAPVLSNIRPKEGTSFSGTNRFCDVSGTVEGATLISVNDEILFINDRGGFYKLVTLKEGDNLIQIKARDVNGNETIVHRNVLYKSN